MDQIRSWVQTEYPRIQKELFEFLRFKSISTDPAFHPEVEACAVWVEKKLRSLGLKSEIIKTSGLPLVYGEDLSAGPDAPTLLLYGHYDVQPVDPIEAWHSDPFEPELRGGEIYARGALDDKGQIFYAIVALEALRALKKKPAVNLKYLIEGEEESGSKALYTSMKKMKEKLRADSVLLIDFGMFDAETPSIGLGARGLVTLEVILRGSKSDLHSGSYGGVAYNPNRALAELIAKFWDQNGSVRVPHFYDDVAPIGDEDRALFGDAAKEFGLEELGIEALSLERGRSLQESNWFRPTVEINGLSGGYSGPGFKTVIPATASAKISCRLVPHQDPAKIARLVEEFLKKNVQPGIQIEVIHHAAEKAFRGRADSALAKATVKAYEKLFSKSCRKTLSGGSIPVIAALMDLIGGDVVGMGFGLAGDNMHAPNEHFGVERFKKGIMTVALLIEHIGGK